MKRKDCTLDEARAAKEKAPGLLADLPVVGVGITRVGNGYGIKVNLGEDVDTGTIPADVDGVPIKAEYVGTIKKR